MKYIILILIFIACSPAYAQNNPKEYHDFEGKKVLVFDDGFDNNKPEWDRSPSGPTDTTEKCIVNTDSINYKNGKYYLYNNCYENVYEDAQIDIDYTRNFEITLIAKVPYPDTSLPRGYIKWNENKKSGQYNTLFFTGFYNQFHTHLGIDPIKKTCIGAYNDLKNVKHGAYDEFVRYTVRKYNDKYYIFVNGMLKGIFPYKKLNGGNIAIGARRNSKVEFDFLGVYYLP